MDSSSQISDSPSRYGSVTRFLHWAMAVLFAWQFTSVGARILAKDSAFDEFMWATHKPLGALLMLLILVRTIWAVLNFSRRPESVSALASVGHKLLYLLMLIVPAIGLIRQYGSGRSFEPFGLPLIRGFEGERIQWMVDLGGNFHGLLGLVLLASIIGHIAAALWHSRSSKTTVMPRIVG
jgi:cytochrome b561